MLEHHHADIARMVENGNADVAQVVIDALPPR